MAKPFAWSYSKLKNYETCPKRHFHVDVAKDYKEEESEQLAWGNVVHKVMADRIVKFKQLPPGYEQYEPWAERVLAGGGTILVEQKLAINDNFGPCAFFAHNAWFRGVADVIKLMDDVALAIDWKTGKVLEDSVQLALTASCIFAHYPAIQHIRTEFVWLKEGDNVSTREDFSRQRVIEMWRSIWPRIESLRLAHANNNFPPQPGRLCRKWCPVSKCPHHGE